MSRTLSKHDPRFSLFPHSHVTIDEYEPSASDLGEQDSSNCFRIPQRKVKLPFTN